MSVDPNKQLRDKYFLDFSGGIRLDKSDFELKPTEVTKLLNFDVDENGKLHKRLGGQQFGTTISNNGAIHNTVYWERWSGGSVTKFQLVNNRAASGDVVYKVIGSRLSAAITTSSTTISLVSSSGFAASGTVEIDGDIISYAAVSSNDLTGVTNITSDHIINSAVHQTIALTGDQVVGGRGVYYAVLNNLLFVQGNSGASTFDGSTLTAVADGDEPNGVFATTYRQRVFTAAVGGAENLIYFSDAGDSTAWTSTNFFTVEDSRGGPVTGLHVTPADELLIFKHTSCFAYDEVTLKQRSSEVGAYNHMVVKTIAGITFTFCPNGVFATNGVSFKKISKPIETFLNDFIPVF
jgi:hypothetical protein